MPFFPLPVCLVFPSALKHIVRGTITLYSLIPLPT
jgi:hypothetical protein